VAEDESEGEPPGSDADSLALQVTTPVTSRQGMSKTRSEPTFGTLKKPTKSPLRVRPPFRAPRVDKSGFPRSRVYMPGVTSEWDERHHLKPDNGLRPQGLRQYFQPVQTMDELKQDLTSNRHLKNTRTLITGLEKPEMTTKRSIVTADGGPPVCPERHTFGGTMRDLDGGTRTWNDRWHTGIGLMNDNMHPDHRTYFTQASLFETSPSQRYRRYVDQEVDHGVWVPIATKKAQRFPPLGGRLRGRSGAPVPGAMP